MKFKVNENCIGCSLCTALCPSVFEMSENGMAVARDEDVNEDEIASAKEAKESCPVGAIEQVEE